MPDRPHTDLEIAKAHRAALHGRLVALMAERRRLDAAERSESTARADLEQLGRDEVDAVRAWAATASSDPAPQPDAARRHELNIAVAASEAHAAAARSAGAATDRDIAEVNRELAQIHAQIDAAALDLMFAQIDPLWAAIEAHAVELREEMAHALGLIESLRLRAVDLRDHGRADAARALFQRLDPIYRNAGIDPTPTVSEVAAHLPEWRAQLREAAR